MGLSLEKGFKKVSLLLIGLTVLLNIFMFKNLPPDMLIKINTNETMSKAIVLLLCPILSTLTLWIASEKNEKLYNIANIIVQVLLFISNFIVIYINIK